MVIKLQYLVLYAKDIEVSRRFYEQLGLSFQQEQHGKGPVHYSTTVSGITMELYPRKDSNPRKERIGVSVDNLEETLLQVESTFPFAIKSVSDISAIIIDPDNRTIELTQEH